MCIMISLSKLAKPTNTNPSALGELGRFDGPVSDWQVDDIDGLPVLSLPFWRHHAIIGWMQVTFTQEEVKKAECHAASLAPYDYLAAKCAEEAGELREALELYVHQTDRHGLNEGWSHVMSEAADAANTLAAWLIGRLPANSAKHVRSSLLYAAVYKVALDICRTTLWSRQGGIAVNAAGRVDWVMQRLMDDVRPVADAVFTAAVAKTAEVAVRPHGRV